ncbi:unnamed protein product, partial [Choristocarpus tenellus]
MLRPLTHLERTVVFKQERILPITQTYAAMKLQPMTIESDEEVEEEKDIDGDSDEDLDAPASGLPTIEKGALKGKDAIKTSKKRTRKKILAGSKHRLEGSLDPSFSFDVDASLGSEEVQGRRGWDFKGAIAKLAKEDPRRARTSQALEDKIEAKRV